MGFFRKVWDMASKLHPAFWVVPSVTFGALVALLASADDKIAPAVISLLGVLIGGALTAAVGLVVVKSAQRAQLTASIWPQRVKIHQEAFTHWTQCTNVIFGDEEEHYKVLSDARTWWDENCLYLSEDVSKRFYDMLTAVRLHRQIVEVGKGQGDPHYRESIEKNFATIMETGRIISEGAGRHIPDAMMKDLADLADAARRPE